MAKLTTRRFFQWALLLPFAMPLVGWLVPKLDGLLFLFLFGGAPYIFVALALWVLIRRVQSLRQLALLAILTPVAYGFALAAAFMLIDHTPYSAESLSEVVVVGAVYSMPFVVIAWVLWALARWATWVQNEFAT